MKAGLLQRLRSLTKTARMWGSPAELECVAVHLSHLAFACDDPRWSLEQTERRWSSCGAPLAGDDDAHRAMRERMWSSELERARAQVVEGYVVVWAGLARDAAREAHAAKWVERLLDEPSLIATPDRLNMVLFAVMGFVAADAQAYVQALSLERHRIGGHALRPLPVVAPRGPSDPALTLGVSFTTWPNVIGGIERVVSQLEAQLPP